MQRGAQVPHMETAKSADPSHCVVVIILCKIQTVHKLQNPKSKQLRLRLPHKEGRLKQSKIRNSESRLQTSMFGFGILGVNTYPKEKCKTLNIRGKKKEKGASTGASMVRTMGSTFALDHMNIEQTLVSFLWNWLVHANPYKCTS